MDIDITLIVMQIVHTLILFLVLRWLLFKPVSEFLNKRKEAVRANIDMAAQERQEAEKLRAEYEGRITDAKQDAQAILQRAHQQSIRLQEEMRNDARKEAQQLLERARTEITLQRDQAIISLRDEVVNLTIAAAGQVIGKNLDKKGQQELVKQFIEGVGQIDEN